MWFTPCVRWCASKARSDTLPAMTAQPDWDLTPYFPSVDSEPYRSFCTTLTSDIEALHGEVEQGEGISGDSVDQWADRLSRVESLYSRHGHLMSYLDCASSADANDAAVKRESALLASTTAAITKLFVAIRARLGAASEQDMKALLGHERVADVAYFVRRARQRATMSMKPELEGLAADLAVDGISGWGRLYDQITGTLTFELEVPGRATETHPVSMTRSLLEDVDPTVRRAAAKGSSKAWHSVSETLAACLNAISGTRLTLYRRRGLGHFLDDALFDAGIARETLDCMLSVVRERQELPRKYLREKARLLEQPKLAFCDLLAPLPGEGDARIHWDQCVDQVLQAFRKASPELGEMSEVAIRDRWIDYQPRIGKRPGGFCSTSHVLGQSRIFMTYNGAMGDVQTLAHELGHAYHAWVMRDMRPWAQDYPMPLAETASTFAENLTTTAVLSSDASKAVKLRILDARLQDAEAFLLNIPMRFDFERWVYEQRANGELSVDDLCQLMLKSQRENYGDALDHEALDPWFWASKLHFYITDLSFYNFPYTFGYLFSAGLFKRFTDQGAAFLPDYKQLLRKTGSGSAETVVKDSIGVDLKKPDFWHSSIDLMQADFDRYQALSQGG